jgi:imidazolonepropionase-like amidohydrolase
LALVGGRILTQSDSGPVEGAVVIRDGKIAAVGPAATIPSDAECIDVTGLVVTPGLIDARSTLWLTSAAARESANDGGLDILDGVNPYDEDWIEVVRQGVTAVYVQPANSGILGGRGAVLRVGPGKSVEELVIKPDAAAQAALGIPASAPAPAPAPVGQRRGGIIPPATQPAPAPPPSANSLTRFSLYEQLRRVLEGVKQSDRDTAWAEAKRDPTKAFLRRVLKGEVPLRVEVHHEDDIRNALRLADDYRLRIVLDSVSHPGKAGELIASRRIPLVLGPFIELEEIPTYRKGRSAFWPGSVVTPNTRWALGTFSSKPRGSRLLRVQAAAAVGRGLDPDQVLRAMTRDAAEILGVGDRLGTIAPGKQADLVVFTGDPLDPAVPVRLAISGGRVVYRSVADPVAVVARTVGEQELPARLPRKYALKTQRLVLEDGRARPGIVLVVDGKVSGLAPELTVSPEIPTYDLGAAVITPGLVAGPSHLGLATVIDDSAEADAGQVRAADVFDPQHRVARDLCAGGFTTAVLTPGSVNVIAGTAGGIRLGAREFTLGDAGVKFVLAASSRNASRQPVEIDEDVATFLFGRPRGPARYPGSLAGQVELIAQALGGKAPPTELYVPRLVREQMQLERRRQVAALRERKLVAFFEAHTRVEVDAALRLIARFELRGVLVGPEELKPFLEEILRLGVGIVAAPTQVGDYDRSVRELVEAAAAGVAVAFASPSAQEMRIAAALAVNAGMPRAAAWRGLTTTSAEIAGLPATTGRLAVGRAADLVIWDGPPLDLRSRPLRVLVDGNVVSASP